MATLFSFVFLFIFALFSATALKTTALKKRELYHLKNAYKEERDLKSLRAEVEFEAYNVINSRPPKKVDTPREVMSESEAMIAAETDAPKKGPSIRALPHLNLYDLLEKTADKKDKETLFYKLFEQLYGKESFYTKELASDILAIWRGHARLSTQKDKRLLITKPSELAKVEIKNPELQKLHYKLLKGCQTQGIQGGYPSLCDYLSAHNYPTQIDLYEAKFATLAALYNEKTALYILENKEKWMQEIKKGELNSEQLKANIRSYCGEPGLLDLLVKFSPPSK